MRRLVPLAFGLFLLSSGGCARVHSVCDGGCESPDAGNDLGSTCSPIAPASFCTEGPGAIPTGAGSIDVLVTGDCLSACSEVRCDVEVAGPGRLDVTVVACATSMVCPPFCATSLHGTCALPSLADGSWEVSVNGAFGFVATVSSVDLPYRDVCWSPASPSPPSFLCGGPAALPVDDLAVCRPVVARQGVPIVVDVVDECADCFEVSGGCRVEVMGDTITLSASRRTCDCPVCGACAPVCVENTVACVVPALDVGTYELVAGNVQSDLVVGTTPDESRRCTRVIVP